MASPDQKQEAPENNTSFESDAKKLADKHLADPNHVITDEDLQNVRVGMAPPPDEPTQEAVENADEKIADRKIDSEDDVIPGGQKATPWDVIK